MTDAVMVPVSVGELFDKISILEIKSERLNDLAKLANVIQELRLLKIITAGIQIDDQRTFAQILAKLKAVNESIWAAEDTIREHESRGAFDESFIAVARSIYRLNDARAAAKREMNVLMGSRIFEEKSYAKY
jgi:orotidine-5'-phosphate decarboxylase